MLKSIELFGFKSFADKTRLEFSEGISGLVGPNGSGKSNIVDAIKWVLGEQSVKKLRGNEMTDVIFGGSGTRGPMNSAEVSLLFDNQARIFAVEAAEVCITRRVYRNGEAEYLINRQPSRLKTVKELLSGTGLGSQALSIIEQGRVQALLESSPLLRRSLFDEAAGVSRFHSKKLEAQRRLERAEQNLTRLRDIVTELENRVKTTKSQAAKAQSYRQYTQRLQELRTESSVLDWKSRKREIIAVQKQSETLRNDETSLIFKVESAEKQLGDTILSVEQIDQSLRKFGEELATLTERIAAEESAFTLQRNQLEEVEKEISHQRHQLTEMNLRNVDADSRRKQTDIESQSTLELHDEKVTSYQAADRLLQEISQKLETLQTELTQTTQRIETESKCVGNIAAEMTGMEARISGVTESIEQCQRRYQVACEQAEKTRKILDVADSEYETCTLAEKQKKSQLTAMQRRKTDRQTELETLQHAMLSVKQKYSATEERSIVLEELLRCHDGVSPGVKEVMRDSQNPASPFRFAHGLVADLLRVDVEAAQLIELALGPAAQYIVVSPEPELFRHIEQLRSGRVQLTGRVGFIWLDPNPIEAVWMRQKGFEGRPGVLGRADRFVKTENRYHHLATRLLARTWIVDNLTVAKELYRESDDRTHFLTTGGEYLASDGALIVGPMTASSGLITRRTEQRSLRELMVSLDGDIREKELSVAVLRKQLQEDEIQWEEATRHHQNSVLELGTIQLKHTNAQDTYGQSMKQVAAVETELTGLRQTLETSQQGMVAQKQKLAVQEQLVSQLRESLQMMTAARRELETKREQQSQKTDVAKIELAKSEERLHFLQDSIKQYEDRLRERRSAQAEYHRREQKLRQRATTATLAMLRIESNLATLYLRKEETTAEIRKVDTTRQVCVGTRDESQSILKKSQSELTRLRTKIHTVQLEIERLGQEQKTLQDRMKEDYDMDIVAMVAKENKKNDGTVLLATDTETDVEPDLENIHVEMTPVVSAEVYQAEIEDLRNKIKRLGNVNLEAIETLDEIETRYTTCSNQYHDLMGAKRAIEKIIDKTNGDSQSLFEETFDGVRHHFRELFQRFFGGGFADIVFDKPENPQESGVDIVARPPGKELANISLMSGGEKTLTCIALLLAFFKYRPNPVCILDEVDAALDEGNIDRFVNVIRDFRTSTQFLIVTHSKKTMACAQTLYGITMQDSGVSKHISVRFEDVNETGEIVQTGSDSAAKSDAETEPAVFSIDTATTDRRAA